MKAIVCGANGAMGKLIQASLEEERIGGLVSLDGENGVPKTFAELGACDAEVIIDFSHHSAVFEVLAYAKAHKKAVVVGTTGHTPEEKEAIFAAFSQVWTLPIYLIGFVALWFHLTHGIWSAFQSVGTSNNVWLPRWKAISWWWATIVCGLFAVEAIVFTIMARGCC